MIETCFPKCMTSASFKKKKIGIFIFVWITNPSHPVKFASLVMDRASLALAWKNEDLNR